VHLAPSAIDGDFDGDRLQFRDLGGAFSVKQRTGREQSHREVSFPRCLKDFEEIASKENLAAGKGQEQCARLLELIEDPDDLIRRELIGRRILDVQVAVRTVEMTTARQLELHLQRHVALSRTPRQLIESARLLHQLKIPGSRHAGFPWFSAQETANPMGS